MFAFINKLGRRGLLYLGLGFQTISLLFMQIAIAYENQIFGFICIGIFVTGFSFSLGGTAYIYQTEILPPEIIPVSSVFQWILTLMVSFYDLENINSTSLFSLNFLFFFTALFGCFIFQGYSVETKNKTDSKILKDWENKTFMF